MYKSFFYFGGVGAVGDLPQGKLLVDSGGHLYGTTYAGGNPGQGVVFELTHTVTGWVETTLYAFSGGSDGANPGAGLVRDANGVLYGTTQRGGTNNGGVVFGLTRTLGVWQEIVLHNFPVGSVDGEIPLAEMILDSVGNLYGTTSDGGSGSCLDGNGFYVTGCGTVFTLPSPAPGQTRWTKKTLNGFTGGTDGGRPKGKLLLDKSGALFGTTFQGGTETCTDPYLHAIHCGVAYKLNPPAPGSTNWTRSVLHMFKGGSDGSAPQGGLIADSAGHLYGSASRGGTHGNGLAFMLSPPAPGQTTWTDTVLDDFCTLADGDTPVGELVRDDAGDLANCSKSREEYPCFADS